MPIELDANAAAASYLRDCHPEHMDVIKATDSANLTKAHGGSQSLDTLLSRMVSFLYVFRGLAEERVQPLAVSSYFQSEDARAVWDLLVGTRKA